MTSRICDIEGCDRQHWARGLCNTHYRRVVRTGSTTLNVQPIESRFMSKISVVGECWLWQAETDDDGYGYFWADGRRVRAHRWSYEHWVGAIPDGLNLDHECNTPGCVRPEHLRPMTQAENVRRYTRLITHCPAGHEYTPENTYLHNGKRSCLECTRTRKRARRAAGLPG